LNQSVLFTGVAVGDAGTLFMVAGGIGGDEVTDTCEGEVKTKLKRGK
jgi:hypothetical protein